MSDAAGNQLIPVNRVQEIIALDSFSKQCRNEISVARDAGNEMLVALTTARAYQGLREMLTPALLSDVRALMNTQIGFKTDRDPRKPDRNGNTPAPYDDETLRDCTIVSMLAGARVVGNEFNILSGGTYLTKEFYERQVREFAGVSQFDPRFSPPEYSQDRKIARVACVARWVFNGRPDKVAYLLVRDAAGKVVSDERLSVRVNAGQSDDQVIGKATRKLCLRVLGLLRGRPVEDSHDEPDGIEDGEVIRRETERSSQTDTSTQTGTQTAAAEQPANRLDGVAQQLAECTEITQANKIANAAKRQPDLTPDELLQLEVWYQETVDRIRDSRGERANRK